MSGAPATLVGVNDVINIVASGAPVSIDILQGVLNTVGIPTKLRLFQNRHLLSACVELLHRRNGHHVLGDEYSMLCLKIIGVCVQVSTLLIYEDLDTYIHEAASHPDPSFTLAKFAISTLYSRAVSTEAHASAPIGGSSTYPDPRIPTNDTVTLLEGLHRERDRLLFSRCAYPDLWCGLSIILYPAYVFLMSNHVSNPMEIAPLLGDLLYRFAAAEFIHHDEEALVKCMSVGIYTRVTEMKAIDRHFSGPAGQQDSELVIKAVTTRFLIGSLTLNLAFGLQEWAGNSVHPTRPDLMSLLVEATITRLWQALGHPDSLSPTYMQHMQLVYMTQLTLYHLESIVQPTGPTAVPQVTRNSLANNALKQDLFSLLARVLVLPLSYNFESLEQTHQQSLDRQYRYLFRFIMDLGDLLPRFLPIAEEAQDSHIDWLKAAQLFDEDCHTHDEGRFVHAYILRCRAIWTKLGASLLADRPKSHSTVCSYPRCPCPNLLGGAPFTCGGCQVVTYCSHLCRYSHWVYGLPGVPHASTCLSLPALFES